MLESMATLKWSVGACWLRAALVALASTTIAACMTNVDYAHPGQSFEPREGQALVFSRIRFYSDGREIFPWDASSFYDLVLEVERAEARHIWLRRLDETGVSLELRPDTDGTLTLWMEPGDYALFGSEDESSGPEEPTRGVVALLRVPAERPAVYAGELIFAEDFRDGWHSHYIFGSGSVNMDSMERDTRKVEARYGALPDPPAVSSWCVGMVMPAGTYNRELVRQLRQLLDEGCSGSP